MLGFGDGGWRIGDLELGTWNLERRQRSVEKKHSKKHKITTTARRPGQGIRTRTKPTTKTTTSNNSGNNRNNNLGLPKKMLAKPNWQYAK